MTKAELAQAIARKHELTHKEAVKVVDTILNAIINSLAKGEKVELRGFGSFIARRKAGRIARNPKTGEPVTVPARIVPAFKTSRTFKELLDVGQGTALERGGIYGLREKEEKGEDRDA